MCEARKRTPDLRLAYVSDQDVPQTVQNEILYRLRASSEELAPKDLERDRLHVKAAALATSLDSMALDALESFDPRDDRHWRADDADGE